MKILVTSKNASRYVFYVNEIRILFDIEML